MLEINGVAMPEPKLNGLKISKNKIWSSNTGRTAGGKMVGDIIATKYKLEIEWAALSAKEITKIDTAISGAFFLVKFIDLDGSKKTITCYAGDPKYPVYSYAIEGIKYTNVSVSLIER